MMKIAIYTIENNCKIFSSESDAVELIEDGKIIYSKIYNSTFTLPKVQANENQNLILANEGTEQEEWILQDKVLQGTFYEKSSGRVETEIFKRDIDKYTEIPHLPQYEDGTMQEFNDTLQVWEYTTKGKILLQIELAEQLENAKIERLRQLESDWEASKLIVIQNGETIYIKHDTKQRDEFIKKIEQVQKEDMLSKVTVSYYQQQDGDIYEISFVPYIWTFIFGELFMSTRDSGLKESSRYHNKKIFDIYSLKIENAKTLEELNALSFRFDNPNGIIININQKAIEMLENSETPDWIKKMILAEKLKNANGEIHLIKKIVCQ